MRCVLSALIMALAAAPAPAQDASSDRDVPLSERLLRFFRAEQPRPAAGPRRVLILCGHPGDDEHRARFAETIGTLHAALVERLGVEQDHIWLLFGSETTAQDGPAVSRSRGVSTQDAIRETVGDLKQTLGPEDGLWVIVMGHSHFDGRRSQFNLPGPDLDQIEFGRIFADLACRELVFWITIPASGFYIEPLSGSGRIVITATEADREVNETTFPHVLARVLGAPPPDFDLDGDGTPSLLDLYLHVARGVAQGYADDSALPTEHAQLEDNGDGRGTEIQIDYLPPELGGRGSKPSNGASRQLAGRAATHDGLRASRITLELRPAIPMPSDGNAPPAGRGPVIGER